MWEFFIHLCVSPCIFKLSPTIFWIYIASRKMKLTTKAVIRRWCWKFKKPRYTKMRFRIVRNETKFSQKSWNVSQQKNRPLRWVAISIWNGSGNLPAVSDYFFLLLVFARNIPSTWEIEGASAKLPRPHFSGSRDRIRLYKWYHDQKFACESPCRARGKWKIYLGASQIPREQ